MRISERHGLRDNKCYTVRSGVRSFKYPGIKFAEDPFAARIFLFARCHILSTAFVHALLTRLTKCVLWLTVRWVYGGETGRVGMRP